MVVSGEPYRGKFGIVTGGSRGIGAATARRLAAKGCDLLLVYTSPSSLPPAQQLATELSTAHNVKISLVQADLSKPSEGATSILTAAREFWSSSGRQQGKQLQVDILINCAGVSSNQFMNDPRHGAITEDEFTRVYAVNVLAPLMLTQTLQPFLPTNRSGRIVNVSSVSSSIGYHGQSVYAGSKAALEAMTRTWSRELAANATVNAVNPGPAWGDMYAAAGPSFWSINQPYCDAAPGADYSGPHGALPDALKEKVLEQVEEEAKAAGKTAEEAKQERGRFDRIVSGEMGGRRPGFTAEIAGTIEMLCTEEAGWTTGSVVCANGGMKMGIA